MKLYKIRNTQNQQFIQEFSPFRMSEKYRISYSKEGGRTYKTLGGAQRFILAIHYRYPKEVEWIKELRLDTSWLFWLKNLSYNLEIVECTIEEKSIFDLNSVMNSWEGQYCKRMNEKEMEGK